MDNRQPQANATHAVDSAEIKSESPPQISQEVEAMKVTGEDRKQKILKLIPELHGEKHAKTVNELTDELPFIFINKYMDIIREYIPPSNWDKIFANIISSKDIPPVNPYKITEYELDNFLVVLHFMPTKIQQHALKSHEDLILDSKQLAKVIKVLSKDMRLLFAEEHADRIKDYDQLAMVIDAAINAPEGDGISIESLVAFARRYIYSFEIQNGKQLCVAIEVFPEKERLAIAEKHAAMILDGSQLSQIIRELPENERYTFAQSQAAKIKNGEHLSWVINKLPENERLPFAQEHRDKIKNGDQFIEVLKSLSEPERIKFAEDYEYTREFASGPGGSGRPLFDLFLVAVKTKNDKMIKFTSSEITNDFKDGEIKDYRNGHFYFRFNISEEHKEMINTYWSNQKELEKDPSYAVHHSARLHQPKPPSTGMDDKSEDDKSEHTQGGP